VGANLTSTLGEPVCGCVLEHATKLVAEQINGERIT
jgi:hypothetical protein